VLCQNNQRRDIFVTANEMIDGDIDRTFTNFKLAHFVLLFGWSNMPVAILKYLGAGNVLLNLEQNQMILEPCDQRIFEQARSTLEAALRSLEDLRKAGNAN
jgi:hypothetical protein